MVELTREQIATERTLARLQSPQAGAVVVFLGTTREFTAGRQTTTLTYESYPQMARQQLERLETEARERWTLVDCEMIHRLGEVPLAEASVLVAVSSAHRREAFQAAQWLMDRIKEDVPIWKQEHWADGSTEWVHPVNAERP